jgi:pSer/pThr/pTyr-binding forkhead associated (FHA) protein
MTTYLEVWKSGGPELVPLVGERVTVGRAEDNTLVLEDRRVSAVHAFLEQVGARWCVRDVGSRNGTFLNGERLLAERVLEPGDEVRVGDSRLVYRAPAPAAAPTTEGAAAAPRLTARERDVLVALCRPLAEGSLLTEPASVSEIAAELVLTQSAVKKHLANLYDKFGLYDQDRRRGHLANEAVTRGAVQVAELRRSRRDAR